VNARLPPAFVSPPALPGRPAPMAGCALVLLPDVDLRRLRAYQAELLTQIHGTCPPLRRPDTQEIR